MSWHFDGTSSWLVGYGFSPLMENTFQVPGTFAAWVWWDGLGTTTDIIAVRDIFGSPAANRQCIRLFKNSSDQLVMQHGGDTTAQNSVFTASTITTGRWYHVAGVFTITSKTSYLNGIAATANTNYQTPTQVTSLQIGAAYSTQDYLQSGGFHNSFFGGRIAHAALWTAALTDQEIRALAAGARPDTIREYRLGAYFPADNTNIAQTVSDPATSASWVFSQHRRQYRYDTLPFGERMSNTGVSQSAMNPPVKYAAWSLPAWVQPAITNKLRAQAAYLKPYTGILPIPNG